MDKKLKYLLFCDYALVADAGKVSAMGIFAKVKKAKFFSFFLVGEVEIDAPERIGKLEIIIQIMNPAGEKVIETDLTGPEIEQKNFKISLLAKFDLIKFDIAGAYKVKVLANGENLAKEYHSLEVVE
jgi:hypothetical protein